MVLFVIHVLFVFHESMRFLIESFLGLKLRKVKNHCPTTHAVHFSEE